MLVKEAMAVDLSTIYKPAEFLGGTKVTLSTILNPLIPNILTVSGIAAFLVILISGFTYITAGGDKTKTAQAQQMLNYGIIGLVVIVASFILTRLMGSILGFKFL